MHVNPATTDSIINGGCDPPKVSVAGWHCTRSSLSIKSSRLPTYKPRPIEVSWVAYGGGVLI
jgi:hypothetical protein